MNCRHHTLQPENHVTQTATFPAHGQPGRPSPPASGTDTRTTRGRSEAGGHSRLYTPPRTMSSTSSQRSAKRPRMSTAVFSPSAEPDDNNQLGSWLFALSLMALRQRLRDHGMKLRDKYPDGQAALRRSLTLLLAPQLPPRTRGRKQWWLEVPDCLGPQEQMLQELAPIRPGMLGHLRK